MRTHLTLEFGENSDSTCEVCGEKTKLIVASPCWDVDEESVGEDGLDCIELDDELSGHYCLKCERLTSLSFNGKLNVTRPSGP